MAMTIVYLLPIHGVCKCKVSRPCTFALAPPRWDACTEWKRTAMQLTDKIHRYRSTVCFTSGSEKNKCADIITKACLAQTSVNRIGRTAAQAGKDGDKGGLQCFQY